MNQNVRQKLKQIVDDGVHLFCAQDYALNGGEIKELKHERCILLEKRVPDRKCSLKQRMFYRLTVVGIREATKCQ